MLLAPTTQTGLDGTPPSTCCSYWRSTASLGDRPLTAYGVLSRGLLSGHWSKERDVSKDFRGVSPRFQGENLDHNLQLVETLRAVASEAGATPAQAAIAWALSRGDDIVPLIGARRRERLEEALQALELQIDTDRIEAAVPADAAAGSRYPAAQMSHLPA